MKKFTIILLVALLVPATGVFGQMQWHEKDGDKEIVIIKSDGGGHGMDCDMSFGKGKGMRGHGMDCNMGPGMGGGMGMGMRGHGIMAMADMLDLTDDQETKIRKLALDHKLAAVDERAAVKKAEITLKALMHDDDANQNKVFAAIDKLAGLKAEVKKAKYAHHQKVKGLLTDEQRDKLKKSKGRGGNMMFFGEPGERGAMGMHKGMKRTVIEFETDDD